jgi:hypothetical protein
MRINASVHLRIASITLLRGEKFSSSRREALTTAERSFHLRGEKRNPLYTVGIVD